MLMVQLQEPALDHAGGHFLTSNADEVPPGTADLHHKLHITIQRFLVIGMLLEQEVKVDIFFYQLSVSIHLIHPHPAFGSGTGRRSGGRGKDGWVSIVQFSIFLFSLIRGGKAAVLTAHFQRCRLRKFRSQECGTVQWS